MLCTIRAMYAENEKILEYFYAILIEIYEEKADGGFAIEDVISQIREKNLPSHLLIRVYRIQLMKKQTPEIESKLLGDCSRI